MLPDPGQVLHFSEDPTLTVFRPHVAATAQQTEPYVWAVDPLGPAERVGDLLAAHEAAGIELRLLRDLRPHMTAVVASGSAASGCATRAGRADGPRVRPGPFVPI